ncbi:cyclin-dependent kinase inhibitor 1 [Patagioenas fasciata monilis]|uniref:Cyclin-dependent kinase inhibitor 1 n=1 Tax=Patagioenas fasciata monilis TaxID=372326 RepID=A0A1V4K8H3_PATFA|nr:cyclin-dependent kinase inhibitor 1 [Patagioenas fasciata monilis]
MEQRPGKITHTCRNLSGPVDHQQLQQDFLLDNSMEGAQQKWNFDFLQDMPAEELLQWEKLKGHKIHKGVSFSTHKRASDYYSTKKLIKTNMQPDAKKSTS